MNFMFPYIGNNHPNWLICFRGVETTNQYISHIYVDLNESGWSRTSPTKKKCFIRSQEVVSHPKSMEETNFIANAVPLQPWCVFWGYLTVCHGRWSFLTRKSSNKTSLNGQFSMAMSNNQKVEGVEPCWAWTGWTFSGFIYLFEGVIFC